MIRKIASVIVILLVFDSIDCDICDICVCVKNCVISNSTESSEGNSTVCSNQIEEYIICDVNDSKVKENQQNLDLNTIQWPNRPMNTSATFNNFKLTYLSNVLCSTSTPSHTPSLLSINLDSNSIKQTVSNPFQKCENLTSISIADNQIDRLQSEFFESTLSLRYLNISHNALSEFDGGILSHCKQIIELDLSHNQITILKVNEILNASPNIERIYAANNFLFAISDNNQNKYLRLKKLNLSGNKMTVITRNTFISYPSLLYLNISANVLGNIEENAFEELFALQILDLSYNHLEGLALKLSENIEHVLLSGNHLKHWPMNNFPKNLQRLELQENDLTEIFDTRESKMHRSQLSSLKFLNLSRNQIVSWPAILEFPELTVLDISYNDLKNIPQYLGSQAPNLGELRLRGNPIKTIEFKTKMSAHSFDFSELPLTEFEASVFKSIESKSECLKLTISHNPALKIIKNSFEWVEHLCYLDLSYNKFQYIDHNWMNWSALDRGVNLQGNPIDCSCNSQWMLDYFVPMLYKSQENHQYLMELRCASPERFKGHRLVRYLNHGDAFCRSQIDNARFGPYQQNILDENDDHELSLSRGLGLWITVSLVIIISITSIIIIIVLARRTREKHKIRRNNRRFNNGNI